MARCRVAGCIHDDETPYSGVPLCLQPWSGDPTMWKLAHKHCQMETGLVMVEPKPTTPQPLSREEMMQMWEEAERYPFVDTVIAFGEAIQAHFVRGK